MRKQAFLFLCHRSTRETRKRFTRLQDGASSFGDVFWLFHASKASPNPKHVPSTMTSVFTDGSLAALGYPMIGPGLIPGHVHFPLLQFFHACPDYAHYWLIEYDVHYAGDWGDFFASITDSFSSDFVSCHVRHHHEQPTWNWWSSLTHPSKSLPREERLRSFNPIFRVSNAGLQCLHEAHSAGWQGHNEVFLPTMIHRAGLSVLDFGGNGPFVPKRFEDRFYTSILTDGRLGAGTMRYRPASWRPGPEQNMLHHPVKSLSWMAQKKGNEVASSLRGQYTRLKKWLPVHA